MSLLLPDLPQCSAICNDLAFKVGVHTSPLHLKPDYHVVVSWRGTNFVITSSFIPTDKSDTFSRYGDLFSY